MKYRLSNNEMIAIAFLLAGIFVALSVASLVTAEGLKFGNAFFATKAYRMPLIGWLLWLFRIRTLDASHIFAVAFVLLAGFSADALTKISLRPQGHPYGKLTPCFMTLLVITDTVLFYLGCLTAWTVGTNWPAVILTTAYLSSIFVFAYVNIYLWNRRTP